MALKDIEKLKEKLEKDPNSKLFVPLAEEYRKEGMLDEAISVLLTGLEKQPGYASARVSLSKSYLEKGMLEEARSELENVIQSSPDNLYAHRKLAEIYRDTGEKDLAVKAYKTVLNLNPMDDEVLNELKNIEGEDSLEQPLEETPEVERALSEEIPSADADVEEVAVADTEREDVFSEETQVERAHADEELDASKSLHVENIEEVTDSVPEEMSERDEDEIEILEESAEGVEEEISFGDIADAAKTDESAIVETSEEIDEKDIKEEVLTEGEDLDLTEPQDKGGTIEDAEDYIYKENYIEAMGIYESILSANPDDKKVLQRIEELKTLFKLMGKDKEALISRLNRFREGLNKKRDEFFRSS